MEKNHEDEGMDREDQELAALLQAVGPRPRPPAGAEASVRAAVETEWRSVVAGRNQRRRVTAGLAMAASAAVAAIALWAASPLSPPRGEPVATVAVLAGSAEYQPAGSNAWETLSGSREIAQGDTIRTAPDARVALALEQGPVLRLDRATRLAFGRNGRVDLAGGAVYVDSDGPGQDLIVDTPFGAVTHLGTQYEARLLPQAVAVAVREGRIRVDGRHGEAMVPAGERLTLTGDGPMQRTVLSPYAEDWDWVASVAPVPAIDGWTLVEFLEWAGRETGREVSFETPAAAEAARTIVLHGSVQGLSPEAALDAIMSTTRLRHQRQDGVLRIGLTATAS